MLTEAVIRPLLKKAGLDPNIFSNLRPISNLTFISKLIERVVNIRISDHMKANNLDCPSQYGYKKHHSTETLLVHFLNEIMVAVFGSKSFLDTELSINGTFTNSGKCIRFNDIVKYLGVNLDNTLTLTPHINSITSACYLYLRKIRSIRKYLSQKDTETLIHAFISSRLDVCNSLFFGLPKYSLLKLQRVQNAAVRTIFSLKKRESVSDHITSLHWLTVDQRVAFKILLLVFKCLNMMAPHPLIDLLKVKDSYTNKLEVNTFFPSSEIGKRAFCYSAPRLWNCLPTSLRVLDNTDSFKAKLKHFLFTDYRDMMQSYNQYKC